VFSRVAPLISREERSATGPSSTAKLYEWVVDMNNHENATTLTTVYAVCGSVPNWSLQLGAFVGIPAGAQRTAHVRCPAGSTVLSGGPVSSSLGTGVNMNSGFPTGGTVWKVAEDNASASTPSVRAEAVCAG
jgi:hypothetical protein